MGLFQRKFRKLNNKGLSLVELICGVTILAIISVTVASVMIVSANSYSQGNAETQVQQEAQLVANQISDLLIDATTDVSYDAGTETLQIVQGSKRYTVARDTATKKLMYTEEELDLFGAPVPGTAILQVMAEGVEKFEVPDVNEPDFAKTGYTRLNIKFANDSQTYEANYGITARNKDAGNGTGVTAAIILPSEVTLEPHESFEFQPTVVGLTNQNVTWSVEGETDEGDTDIDASGKITIGKDETANIVRVHCETVARVGSNPAAECWVNVYVRRVNLVTIHAEHVDGVEGQAGAKYKLTAKANGNNLSQVPGVEYDDSTHYVNPYVINWPEGTYTGYKVTKDTTSANGETAYVELTSGLTPGSTISVTATAAHPAGANKKSTPYGTVTDTWTLTTSSNALITGAGWLRQSNQAQASVDSSVLNAVLASLKASTGLGDGDLGQRFRFSFREVTGEPSPGVYTFGAYVPAEVASTGWIWNSSSYGADADGSMSMNLRPIITGTLDYNKSYLVTVQLVIVDKTKTEADSDYILAVAGEVSDVVVPVAVTFNSASNLLNLTNGTSIDQASAPTVTLERNQQYTLLEMSGLIGIDIDGNSFSNSMEFTVEQYNESTGTWGTPTCSMDPQKANGSLFFTIRGQADQNNPNNYDEYEGLYRITVTAKGQPDNSIDVANGKIVANGDGSMDYVLSKNVFHFYIDDPLK